MSEQASEYSRTIKRHEAREAVLDSLLQQCNEARTLDAKQWREVETERFERLMNGALERGVQKYIQPKLDSVAKL